MDKEILEKYVVTRLVNKILDRVYDEALNKLHKTYTNIKIDFMRYKDSQIFTKEKIQIILNKETRIDIVKIQDDYDSIVGYLFDKEIARIIDKLIKE